MVYQRWTSLWFICLWCTCFRCTCFWCTFHAPVCDKTVYDVSVSPCVSRLSTCSQNKQNNYCQATSSDRSSRNELLSGVCHGVRISCIGEHSSRAKPFSSGRVKSLTNPVEWNVISRLLIFLFRQELMWEMRMAGGEEIYLSSGIGRSGRAVMTGLVNNSFFDQRLKSEKMGHRAFCKALRDESLMQKKSCA